MDVGKPVSLALMTYNGSIEVRENWAADNYNGPSANILNLDGRCIAQRGRSLILQLPCFFYVHGKFSTETDQDVRYN